LSGTGGRSPSAMLGPEGATAGSWPDGRCVREASGCGLGQPAPQHSRAPAARAMFRLRHIHSCAQRLAGASLCNEGIVTAAVDVLQAHEVHVARPHCVDLMPSTNSSSRSERLHDVQ
jgi:hypothetical protein